MMSWPSSSPSWPASPAPHANTAPQDDRAKQWFVPHAIPVMNRACANGGAPANGSNLRGRSQEPLRGASRLGSTAYKLESFSSSATVSPTAALCALHPIFLRPPSAGAATAFPSSLMTTTPAGPQATLAMEPLKDTAAGVALALRRGPLFFKAGRCGTRPQAATQLVGAVAVAVVQPCQPVKLMRHAAEGVPAVGRLRPRHNSAVAGRC